MNFRVVWLFLFKNKTVVPISWQDKRLDRIRKAHWHQKQALIEAAVARILSLFFDTRNLWIDYITTSSMFLRQCTSNEWPRTGITADDINLLLAWILAGTVQQRQTWGRKALGFSWATFGWASCNIDTFV